MVNKIQVKQGDSVPVFGRLSSGKKTKRNAFIRSHASYTSLYGLKTLKFVDAINLLKDISRSKMAETLEIALKLGIDPRQTSQTVRGVAIVPHSLGKKLRIAVICRDEKIQEALDAGADIAGNKEIIDQIAEKKIDFDLCITTPDMMAMLGKVASILGQRGLMPNPKTGTITTDIVKAVKDSKLGRVEFRNDKGGIIHAGIGKLNAPVENLIANAHSLVNALIRVKPSGLKGSYIKTLYLSSTMGPSVKIDLSEIDAK